MEVQSGDLSSHGKRHSRQHHLLILLAFISFISLGLPDTILGVGWPFIRSTFGKPIDSLALLLLGGVSGCLTSSFLSGTIVRYIGVGKLLLISSVLMTVTMLGDSIAPAFAWMVGLSFIGGLGAGAIDAGMNAFAAKHFSSRVMNWLHAFYGIGATIGPAMMTAIVSSHRSWRLGYLILAITLGLLSVLFLLTIRLWEEKEEATSTDPTPHATMTESLRLPMVWMQSLLFFIYCGIESTASQLVFSLFTEGRGIRVSLAGSSIAAYWASLTIGRVIFGQAATFLSHTVILRIGTGLSVFAAFLIWWHPIAAVGIAGMVLLGFALAPIYPTLMSDTPLRMEKRFAAQSVGFQVSAAALGIAAFPGLVSAIARRHGLEVVCIYLVMATVVLLILNETVTARRRV